MVLLQEAPLNILDGPPPGFGPEDLPLQEEQCDALAAAKSSTVWWRLLWCHERCHKGENEDWRMEMRDTAQDYGAALICLKKARQFGSWMDRALRPPFVLVTDWREAQPCIQAISQHKGRNCPVMTVVICDSKRQLSRASEWASRLGPEVGAVQVFEKDAIPTSLLAGLIFKCFGPCAGTKAGDPVLSRPDPFKVAAAGPTAPASLFDGLVTRPFGHGLPPAMAQGGYLFQPQWQLNMWTPSCSETASERFASSADEAEAPENLVTSLAAAAVSRGPPGLAQVPVGRLGADPMFLMPASMKCPTLIF